MDIVGRFYLWSRSKEKRSHRIGGPYRCTRTVILNEVKDLARFSAR
jgi:hypothetical protein